MPPLPKALLILALLSTILVVSAAPATGGKVASKGSSLKTHAKSLSDKKKSLRRGKRQVAFADVGGDDATEEALIRQQLSQLSDSELAALANIVRGEMDRYVEPEFVAVPQYEIIEIPDEYLEEAAVMEPFPRDRRSMPTDWATVAAAAAEEQEMNEPGYIVLPEEAVIEALEEEQDEQELRDRIAEIAQILNERATRRSRLL
ncbi:hypothetical protein RB195_006148 [Necator americanus]|uniref:Uncharacterized protein n=1 Tax=Necator americanus TaxID=51031 RepID=A0ABR1BUZ0_NECAM